MGSIHINVDDNILLLIDRKAEEEERNRSQQIRFILKEWRGQQAVGWVNETETVFWLRLDHPGEKLISCIKEVRAITNLGLKESKELVDRAREDARPATIARFKNKEEAESALQAFEAAGSTAHITEGLV